MMQRKSSFLVSSKSKLTEIRGQVSIILPSKLLDLVLRQLRLSKERCALISCQSTPAMHNLQAIIRLEKKVHSGQVRLFRSARNVKSLFRRLPALESMTLTGLKVSPNLEFLAQSWASKQDLTTLIHLKSRFTTTFTNVKTYSIGKRLVEKIAYSPGPGFYQHEKSEAATKCRNPTHRMDSSPKRPDNFSKVNQGYIAEPGMYSVQP